jgi:hypothetical protein
MRRISLISLVLFALLLAAGCGEYGQRYEGESSDVSATGDEEPKITNEEFTEAVRKRDGCTDVKEFESEGSTHTQSQDEDVDYKNNPPHSGDHNPMAAEWGLYDEFNRDSQTVHNLEHGHIVISHKGLTAKQEDTLLDQARKNPYHLLVQPREKNPKKGVYYTSWLHQMYCEVPSAEALQFMVDNHRDQGPELFTDDASRAMNAD